MPSPKPEKVHRMVGKRIRFIRITLGLSEVELASRLTVSRQTVSNIETGKVRITICDLERYAKALGTTPLTFGEGHLVKKRRPVRDGVQVAIIGYLRTPSAA